MADNTSNNIRTVGNIVGLGFLAPKTVGASIQFVGSMGKDLSSNLFVPHKKESRVACPACCMRNLQGIKSEDDNQFRGYACPACGLSVECNNIKELKEIIAVQGRALYLTRGGQENHRNAHAAVDMDVGMARIWLALAVVMLLFAGVCLYMDNAVTFVLGLAMCGACVTTSISFAYQAYVVDNGLMYLKGKPVFKDWFRAVGGQWWKFPPINEIDYDNMDNEGEQDVEVV